MATVVSLNENTASLSFAIQLENGDLASPLSAMVAFTLSLAHAHQGTSELASSVVRCTVPVTLNPGAILDLLVDSKTCPGADISAATAADLNALLWWPYQMGAQTMQSLTVELLTTSNPPSLLDSLGTTVGLRLITAENDEAGHRLFRVNHAPILIRGGGYAQDVLLRSSPERYLYEVTHARNLGLNAIRFEGKFPDDLLFDIMSQAGVLALPGICCWYRILTLTRTHQVILCMHPFILL